MLHKHTQHQGIFYQLYKARKNDPEEYIPIWKLIGEVYITETGLWSFISYEVSARMSELHRDNPRLFDYVRMTGKTGAKFYAWRIRPKVSQSDILDKNLKEFYLKIKN